MLEIHASCPSCGAPLTFQPGTLVAVCSRCRSLSARTDRDPKLVGKVADLVATGSRLALGLEGHWAGRTFRLAGRTQLRHPLGGVWDEWYLSFGEGRWGWLAEAQGKFYLTFRQDLNAPPPPFESLDPGQALALGSAGAWVVAETGIATLASAEGEIPWTLDDLGATYAYADLQGAHAAFATLDYSEDPALFFAGRGLTLADLQLKSLPEAAGTNPHLPAQALPCPHCASPLRLQAPDAAERVVCPSCGSLLDVREGRLSYLKTLKQPEPNIRIPLGREGTLRGHSVVCTGVLLRSCTLDHVSYPWREYLLLDRAQHGFLWLVESDGHWSLAETVSQGDIHPAPHGRSVEFRGTSFRHAQSYSAEVKGAWGEFYWKVTKGERVEVNEFAQPPHLLAQEVQQQGKHAAEVNWSLSTYLEPEEVWRAFQLDAGPPPRVGIAPHQPNPHRAKAAQLFRWMGVALAVWLLLLLVQCATHRAQGVYSQTFDLTEASLLAQVAKLQGKPAAEGAEPGDVVLFSAPFEIQEGHKNLEVRAEALLNNGWVDVDGALVAQASQAVELFQIPLSFYSGVDEGEHWTEGHAKDGVYLSALPPGSYVLRLAPSWEGTQPPSPILRVEVRSGVMHAGIWILTLLGILVFPIFQGLRVSFFENQRWSNTASGDSE